MAYRAISDDFAEDVIEELLTRLERGDDMAAICADPRMPSASTFWRWSQTDDELGKCIVRAREIGYYIRADKAVADAKAAKDGATGRLAFDAERWRLSKLSRAFADKIVHAGDGDAPLQVVINKPGA
jgi:hypothetical protein